MASARAEGFAAFWSGALAEGVELIYDAEHHITSEGVVHQVLDIVGGHVARDAGLLGQDVIGLEREGEGAVLEELIAYRGVPHPAVLVIAFGVAACGGV